MTTQATKRKRKDARKWALKQYERHRRHNLVYAKPGILDFVIILDNLKPSYNIGKIFRSADAFGAREVHLIGIEYFEIKSAKGSFKWVPAVFHNSFDSCHTQLVADGYQFFTFEPQRGTPVYDCPLPVKSAFIFGHEEYGISFAPEQFPDMRYLNVPQTGRVGCLNVSIAASVVMYEYFRQQKVE